VAVHSRPVRRVLLVGLLLGVCAIGTPWPAVAAPERGPTVAEVDLTGPIDPLLARYAEHTITQANRAGDSAVLVRLDTPGGLDSSMRSIIKAILNSPVPVVCWVGPSGARAASAGTFILVGCPVAAMAPGTNAGAAHPVGITGGVMSEKVTNDAAAYIRSLAERWGRNADWAERAVRSSVSASANEALQLHVIDLLAQSRSSLLHAVDGRTVRTAGGDVRLHVVGAHLTVSHPTITETLLHALIDPNFAFLFFILGIVGMVSVIIHPGVHILGVVGLVLFVVSLIAFGMLPVTIAGLVLLAASDVFFIVGLKLHGRGVPEVAAVACLVLGGLFLFNPSVPNARVSRVLIAVVAVAVTAFFVFVMRAVMRARFTPVRTSSQVLVGSDGVVVRALDPEGVVRVRGEAWTARSAAGRVEEGSRVRVVAVKGLTVEVVPEPAPEQSEVG
jgi:membrane-bound serine protease (ClpP class)